MQITTESLAYWYFRLNGFFGHKNYIIHGRLRDPDHATDVDFLGIRFMHRKELQSLDREEFMVDDIESDLFKFCPKDKIYICLVEVKRGQPEINSSWIDNSNTLEKILRVLGCINQKFIPKVIKRLQRVGFCMIHRYFISFVMIGDRNYTSTTYDKIPIIKWDEILRFIYKRFKIHRRVKENLSEWYDFEEARRLREIALQYSTFDDFRSQIEIISVRTNA